MGNPQLEIQIIACLVAASCSILGVFLVLKKTAMISDAISHSILPGIVIGFFITQDLNSPILILLAAFSGVLTVALVEYFHGTKLIKEDTAMGLVFPAMFSIGVIMISRNADDIHLDTDAVLLGELAFAPFNRFELNGMDLGPKAIWVGAVILIMILTLLFLFFKELKISTFDAGLSASLGISPVLIHYGLMSVSSITIVGAFDAVGAILVVALIIVPAATAYLLTNDLKRMLLLAIGISIIASISGYWLAYILDASIAGSIATALGIIFMLVFLFAPGRGYISVTFNQRQQKLEVSLLTFLLHLSRHSEESERSISHLKDHFDWQENYSKKILNLALKNNFIQIDNSIVSLNEKGLEFTQKSLGYILENRIENVEKLKRDFFLFRA